MKTFFCRLIVWISICFLVSGCMLVRLHEDLEKQEQYSSVSGIVESNSPFRKPIQVLLVKINEKDNADNTIVNSTVMYEPGPFKFLVLPGTYMVGAFEDRDEDLSFHPDDYVGWHGAPDTIVVGPDEDYKGFSIVLRPPKEAHRQFPLLYTLPPFNVSEALEKAFRMGDVVKLSDPRFAAKNGNMGFWEPLKFITTIGGGIFFLQKYEPGKIPVLIIHGAGGNPVEFEDLIKSIDRDRFQPWVLFYPSGMRLGIVSQWTCDTISILRVQYKFKHLYIVAHSMGGLVARDLINRMIKSGSGEILRFFVSMSTPWDGHAFAKKGAEQCPAVIPAWYDMTPGSPFIKNLFKTPLPSHLEYNLFFSYRGGWHLTIPRNNDGTVALRSELFLPAQLSAKNIFGFDVSHGDILSDPVVIERMNILFEERSKEDGR
jgi:pimeloyl-ACP methyl ester carboxylesterase